MAGRFTNECGTVPPLIRKKPGGVNSMARRRGEMPRASTDLAVSQQLYRRIPSVGTLHIERDGKHSCAPPPLMNRSAVSHDLPASLSVGGGTEHVEILGETAPPRIA